MAEALGARTRMGESRWASHTHRGAGAPGGLPCEDPNAEVYATRRLTFEDGALPTREYWRPDDQRVSLELFGPHGFKREQIRYERTGRGEQFERHHWYYDHGWPIRQVVKGNRSEYGEQGDDRVKVDPE